MLKWTFNKFIYTFRIIFYKQIISKFKKHTTNSKFEPIKNKIALRSPFEDISGENIIKSVDSKFKIIKLQRYLALTHYIAAQIHPKCKIRFILIKFIMKIDSILVYFHILKPEYFFIIAYKEDKLCN